MSWTRLDDTWGDDPVFDQLDHQARWHYLMMIQVCSRGERYDGTMRLAKARQCSDVEDAMGCIAQLVQAGLVDNVDGATLRVVRIDDHLPPKYLRDPERRAKDRARKRAERARRVPADVTRDVSRDGAEDSAADPGQDRPGQEETPEPENDEEEMWEEYRQAWPEDAA